MILFNYIHNVEFKISEDEAAQDEWEKILNRFK